MSKSKKAEPAPQLPARTLDEQGPSPDIKHISELAESIFNGRILLPKFQRGHAWKRRQILELLDSVSRGYPIGSVLLWQTKQQLASDRTIADLDIQFQPADYPYKYLLDGQQRLSAICGSLYWRGDDASSQWNIVYDLRAQRFLHLDTLDDPPAHQIRLNSIPEPSRYFARAASIGASTMPDKDFLGERARKLFDRFTRYKIATVTLGEMDLRAVGPIFERINSSGTALTVVDLMRAATWDEQFDLIDSIKDILGSLPTHFHGIESKYLLRSLAAAAGGGFAKTDADVLRHDENVDREQSVDKLKQLVTETKAAYHRMVDYLMTQACVASHKAVPYANQLVVLGEIFRRLPKPTSKQYKAISTWFWRSTLTNYFAGWSTPQMVADLAAVKAFAATDATEIPVDAAIPNSDIWVVGKFGLSTARAKLLGLILGQRQPIDLLTGQRVPLQNALAWSNAKEFHHFFPKEYLRTRSVPKERHNVLANFVMLTSASNKRISGRSPSEYLKEVELAAGPQLPDWLASNMISEKAYQAALKDDYEAFLKHRAQTLHEVARTLAGLPAA